MKLSALVCVAAVALCLAPHAHARKDAGRERGPRAVTWKVDNLKKIGGNRATVIGAPQVIKAPKGRAVLFDGARDGLLLEVNPVAGARAFTIEAVIRPDAGGPPEQRWMHIQEAAADNRVMLETRVREGFWFLDTFIKNGSGPENSRTLFDEPFKHPVGRWYHVALVYDGALMRNYVDGKEELSGPLTVAPLAEGRTSIGVRQNRVHWFKGAISRARFTPRALAPREFMSKD
ncbi:MAG TPA: LamG domain-containing protein [Pyrinomonadaceae bacterium]